MIVNTIYKKQTELGLSIVINIGVNSANHKEAINKIIFFKKNTI